MKGKSLTSQSSGVFRFEIVINNLMSIALMKITKLFCQASLWFPGSLLISKISEDHVLHNVLIIIS